MSKISKKLWARVLAADGVIESGEIANMRTYRMQPEPKIHARLLGPGETRTLCGVPLRNHDQWAWQFVNRGRVPDHAPSGVLDVRYGCKSCRKNPIMQALAEVSATRRRVFGR